MATKKGTGGNDTFKFGVKNAILPSNVYTAVNSTDAVIGGMGRDTLSVDVTGQTLTGADIKSLSNAWFLSSQAATNSREGGAYNLSVGGKIISVSGIEEVQVVANDGSVLSKVVELAGTSKATIVKSQTAVTGVLNFGDIDRGTHTVTLLNASGTYGALTQVLASDATDNGLGKVVWTYAIDKTKVGSLSASSGAVETFVVRVTDESGSNSGKYEDFTIKVAVLGSTTASVSPDAFVANTAPIFVADEVSTTREEMFVLADVLANDSDPENQMISLVSDSFTLEGTNTNGGAMLSGSAVGSVEIVEGKLKFTPAKDFNGTAIITYETTDGQLKTAGSLNVSVTAVNDPPVVLSSTNGTTTEDAADELTATVFVSFKDLDLADTLTYSFTADQANKLSGTLTAPQANNSGAAADGSVSYTYKLANSAVQYLAKGQPIVEKFTITASDGHGGTASREVTVTITGTNDAPMVAAITNVNGEVTELGVDGNPNELTTSGSFDFSDVDLNDRHTATTSFVSELVGGNVVAGATALGTLEADVVKDGMVTRIEWTFTLNKDAQGVAEKEVLTQVFNIRVSDGTNSFDQEVVIQINGRNDPPVISLEPGKFSGSVTEDMDVSSEGESEGELTTSGSFFFSDPDNAGFTDTDKEYSIESIPVDALGNEFSVGPMPPSYGVFQPSQDTQDPSKINWTFDVLNQEVDFLAKNQKVIQYFKVTVDDLEGGIASRVVTVTISGTNDAPTVSADMQSAALVEAGVGVAGTATASISLNKGDVDTNDMAMYDMTALTEAGWMSDDMGVTFVKTGMYGAATLTISTGVVSYVLNNADSDTNALAGGASVNDDFTVYVKDGSNSTDSTLVRFAISGTNDAPTVTVTQTVQVTEDTAMQVTVVGADVDTGDVVTYTAGVATKGTVSGGAGGVFTYTPNLNTNGADSFVVTVTDRAGATAQQFVTLNVAAVNDAPAAVADTLSATEDSPVTFTAGQLLGNDTDVESQSLRIASVTSGTGGTVALNADGNVVFTPTAQFNGSASFSYIATDGSSANAVSNSATVTVNVAAVNDAPVAVDDILTATEDTAVTFMAAQLLGNDTDVESQSLRIASVTSGTGGTVALNADGNVVFTPTSQFNGPATFSYTATDGSTANATSTSTTVTVNVAAVNDAPVAPVAATVSVAENTIEVGTFAATDVDNATLAYSLSGTNAELFNINASTGSVTFKASPNYEAAQKTFNFNVMATDSGKLSSTQGVTVNVTDVNEAPTAVALNNTVTSLAENTVTTSRVKVADIAITDDALGNNTITLTGTDAASFVVDAGVLYLKASTALNFEAKTSYAVTVSVADGALPGSAPVSTSYTLSVTNLDEVAPTITSATTAAAIAENSGAGQVVYTVTSTDTQDISGGVTYSLNANTGDVGAFTINGSTGAVTLTGNPDVEAKPSYSFTVVATDAARNFSEQAVTLGVTNVAETLQVGTGKQFTTIQAAVNAAIDGDTIAIDAGTYTEVLNLGGKAITLDGAGKSGQAITTLVGTILVPGHAQGMAQGQLNGSLIIKDLAINATGQQFGVGVQAASAGNTGAITLDNVAISGAINGGFNYTRANNGSSNPALSDTLGTITLRNSSFADNQSGGNQGGNSEISIYGYNQVLVIDGVSVTGQAGEAVRGIQVRGLGMNGTEASYSAMRGLTLNNIEINGAYSKSAVALQNYSDIAETISGVVFNNVTTGFGTAFQADGVGGTLDLSGVSAVGTLLPASGTTPPALTLVQSLGSADSYTGSVGADLYVVGSADTVNAGVGMDTVLTVGNYAPTTNEQLMGVESVVNVATVATRIDLSSQSEGLVIVGNALADDIKGGQGNDTIDGGAGLDMVSYSGAVSFGSALGKFTVNAGAAGTDSLVNVERVMADGKTYLLVGNGGYSLSDALAAAQTGQTIVLADGNYSSFSVSKSITILGANAGVAGTGTRGAESVVNGGVLINAADVKIDGIKVSITGAATGQDNSLIKIAAANAIVTNSVLERTGGVPDIRINSVTTPGDRVTGIRVQGSDAVISSNLIRNQGDDTDGFGGSSAGLHQGIYGDVATSADMKVLSNTISNVRTAIGVDYATTETVIDHNTVFKSGSGVSVGSPSTATDLTNVITHNTFNLVGGGTTFNFQNMTTAPTFTGGSNTGTLGGVDGMVYLGSRAPATGDVFTGTAAVEAFAGQGGNDVLLGAGGNDIINGGTGSDTAVYSGNYADYTFSSTNGVVTVTDGTTGRDGIDTLVDVENVRFTDRTLTVNQVLNKAATDLALSAASVTENVVTTAGVKVGDISITDPTGGTNVLSVSGTDAAAFEVRNGTELFFIGASPNFEVKPSYLVTITATDANGGLSVSYDETFTITVNNVDEVAPTITSGATASVNENVLAGSTVYTATSTDTVDYVGGSTSYNLKAGTGDDTAFVIDSSTGVVSINASPDFENKSSYSFTVVARDAAGNASEKVVALSVINVNEAPTTAANATVSVAENSTVVGTFAATDVDMGDSLTYSLMGTNAALFDINSATGAVTFKVAPNYEAEQKTFNFNVVAADSGRMSSNQAVTVNVTDVNEAPTAVVLNNTVGSLAENTVTTSRVKVAEIAITDDALGTNAITLTGTDAASFEVVGHELHLKAGTSLNFEDKTSYAVTVNVRDTALMGSTPVSTPYTLSVTDTNEAAMITGTTTGAVKEDTVAMTTITGDLNHTDVDAADADDAWVAVGNSTATTSGMGAYTVTAAGVWSYSLNNTHADVQALREGAPTTDTFIVTTSGGTQQTVTITITGTNDAVVLSDTTNPAAVAEALDASAQDLAAITGAFVARDMDTGDTLTASVGSVSVLLNNASFTLPMNAMALITNALAVAPTTQTSTGADQMVNYTYNPAAANLDFLRAGDTLNITYMVNVGDGVATAQQDVTFTITGTNDKPIVALGSVNESSFTLVANDPDMGTNLTLAGSSFLAASVGTPDNQLSNSVNSGVDTTYYVSARNITQELVVSDGASVTSVTDAGRQVVVVMGSSNSDNPALANNTLFVSNENVADGTTNQTGLLYGFGGDDMLFGASGNDQLFGGSGRDTLKGGRGVDKLSGGTENDTFVFAAGDTGITAATADVILDFMTGSDSLKFGLTAGTDANYAEASALTFDAGLAAANGSGKAYYLAQVGTDSFLFVNRGTDMMMDEAVKLVGVNTETFAASDIMA